jgi:hypothetical protein
MPAKRHLPSLAGPPLNRPLDDELKGRRIAFLKAAVHPGGIGVALGRVDERAQIAERLGLRKCQYNRPVEMRVVGAVA